MRVRVAKHDADFQRLFCLKVDERRGKSRWFQWNRQRAIMGISYHIRAAYGGKTHNGGEKERDRGERRGHEKIGRLDGY